MAEAGEVVENISGAQAFVAAPEAVDPMRSAVELKPAPDGIPEKFWDGAKGEVRIADLVKSYSELETKFSAPKDDDPPADDPPADDPPADDPPADDPPADDPSADDPPADAPPADLTEAMTAAQAVYAEKGELPAEVRAPFHKAGISDEQIDLYLAGVKAYEQGLKSAATQAAGVEDYAEVEKAVQWAATNWAPKKIAAFNAQTGDVETIGGAVAALFADYRKAEPGEGKLVNLNSGGNRGDVFTSTAEFQAALKVADAIESPSERREARRAVIAKQDRSLKSNKK